MGGGDLNLKKSWHPSTLKNQERVWKAEQQKHEEEKKIAELQQQLKEERSREELEQTAVNSGKIKKNENSELNWMYKGPGSHVSRESYLLGRKIDKAFEMLEKEETTEEKSDEQANKSSYTVEHDINPESVIQKDNNNKQVDMKRKLLEDPLLMIRQNEEATKLAITSNPVKMKHLQLLISSLKEKKKKKKKKHKNSSDSKSKKKKSKEKKKKKEKNTKKKKKKDSKKKSSDEGSTDDSQPKIDNDDEDETSDEEKALRRKKIKQLIDTEMKRAAERRESNQHERGRSSEGNERHRNDARESEKDRHYGNGSNRSDRDYDSRHKDTYKKTRLDRSRSRSRERKRRRSEERRMEEEEEEMERKREEMQENAVIRDTQRKKNVDRYKEDLRKEEEEEKNTEKFVRNLGNTSVGSSVESRIRSKVSSVQRGASHMESNFIRK